MVDVHSDLTSLGIASDSAVVAFWKLPRGAGSSAPLSRHAKVHDLPTELLLIIFRFVCALKEYHSTAGWVHGISPYHDVNSPTLFPYAIAAVCPRWRDIIAMIPEFWTRVVMVVDFDLTTPPTTLLSWSRNLPLEVIVTRMKFDRTVDSQQEQDQVVLVMKALVPSHVNRSQNLHFNVKFSSSLPPFPDSFQGYWSNLSKLYLQCQEDNGGPTDTWQSIISTKQQCKCPDLGGLLVDGRNFYNACRKDSQWIMRSCPYIRDLSISHYTPLPGDSFSSADLMRPIATLPSLGALHINDLSLHPSPSVCAVTLRPRDEGCIHFSNIYDFGPIANMLHRLPDRLHISITHCAIRHISRHFNWNGRLTLRDIEADEHLVPLLRCWDGEVLILDNCPGFDDDVLDLMAKFVDCRLYCAPRMTELAITDCSNFSADALVRCVSTRMGSRGRILRLRVTGFAPDISTVDRQRILQHVDDFEYAPSSF